jgi:uncharacterized protein YjiS (DUF1127 family)/uncharacterized metal-binding protein
MLQVDGTTGKCPIGEITGARNMKDQSIPVISCEGACIRGEIARLAANIVAKEEGYRRGCHGELFAVPDSAIAKWTKEAQNVVVIDGCFLKCHGRIVKNLVEEGRMIQFDALKHHKKYSDLFDIDDVPEAERKAVAHDVADWVLAKLKERSASIQTEPVCGMASKQPWRERLDRLYTNWRTRRQLAELDSHQLKDIGVSRTEAMEEVGKPFWKS